jgi:hypothetical protein
MSLADNDMAKFKQKREQENAARQWKIGHKEAEAVAKPAKRRKKKARGVSPGKDPTGIESR